MSDDPKSPGAIARGWWRANLGARESAAARALAARLRRAAPMAALCEPAVMELARALHMGPGRADSLVRLVCLLAEVREEDAATLARRLGGSDPTMSPLRFQRLMRAECDELIALLRRAVGMADRRCNVAALAQDLLYWEEARPRWCFHYFGADAPRDDLKESVK
ncbi:type I-E CRISPR-associated protein Cse2/CasB [Rhodovulum sp. MB263]|uniref:type I-E CRISPR-associated protein Cse2/CasB n=1 Tax=Rhodovulum sp. (strain MB263) TaxID=308754 RepID=UPI0009B7A0BB|nr:type I-E CRISPR-associated protein Cse2/CasB [Rhodovulum sp. MB263]ARC88511.1 type I-E CRISPR-associated protein Cse2/CasB [Rhodovulum sp. MB263]